MESEKISKHIAKTYRVAKNLRTDRSNRFSQNSLMSFVDWHAGIHEFGNESSKVLGFLVCWKQSEPFVVFAIVIKAVAIYSLVGKDSQHETINKRFLKFVFVIFDH
jgi:hypothetical protein